MKRRANVIALWCTVSLLAGAWFAPSASARNIVQETIDAINEVRYYHGLGQLHLHDALERSAFFHAEDMAERNYFAHWTPEGWSPDMRMRGQGFQGYYTSEILSCGSVDPWTVVRGWMTSPGHRRQILSTQASVFGVAHYFSNASQCRHVWVVNFGS